MAELFKILSKKMLFPYFRSIIITPAVKVDLYFKASNSDTEVLIIDLEEHIAQVS